MKNVLIKRYEQDRELYRYRYIYSRHFTIFFILLGSLIILGWKESLRGPGYTDEPPRRPRGPEKTTKTTSKVWSGVSPGRTVSRPSTIGGAFRTQKRVEVMSLGRRSFLRNPGLTPDEVRRVRRPRKQTRLEIEPQVLWTVTEKYWTKRTSTSPPRVTFPSCPLLWMSPEESRDYTQDEGWRTKN